MDADEISGLLGSLLSASARHGEGSSQWLREAPPVSSPARQEYDHLDAKTTFVAPTTARIGTASLGIKKDCIFIYFYKVYKNISPSGLSLAI